MERQNLAQTIPIFLILGGQIGSVLIGQVTQNGGLGLATYGATIVGVFVYVFYAAYFAQYQARGFLLIWVQPTTRRGKWWWKWSGRIQIWHKAQPTSSWVPDGVCPDGTIGYWQTVLAPARLNTRHPRYNNRGRIDAYIFRHRVRWDRLIRYEEGIGVWNGFQVVLGYVAFMWADEVMPDVTLLPFLDDAGKLRQMETGNHVPFVGEDLIERPVFWVRAGSGTRIMEDERRDRMGIELQMPALGVDQDGRVVPTCFDCGTELRPVGTDAMACPACKKEWDVSRR